MTETSCPMSFRPEACDRIKDKQLDTRGGSDTTANLTGAINKNRSEIPLKIY